MRQDSERENAEPICKQIMEQSDLQILSQGAAQARTLDGFTARSQTMSKYRTVEQEYDHGKRVPDDTRIVSCEYLGKSVAGIEYFLGEYILLYSDGKKDVVSGDKVVVCLAA